MEYIEQQSASKSTFFIIICKAKWIFMKMDFFFFEKYNDFPVFLQSCEQKIILRVLSNPLFLKIIFYFIWYIVGITNLYSLSTFVHASLVFSRLISENPVQRKSIWQPIPDFVIIWFLGKKNPSMIRPFQRK